MTVEIANFITERRMMLAIKAHVEEHVQTITSSR